MSAWKFKVEIIMDEDQELSYAIYDESGNVMSDDIGKSLASIAQIATQFIEEQIEQELICPHNYPLPSSKHYDGQRCKECDFLDAADYEFEMKYDR